MTLEELRHLKKHSWDPVDGCALATTPARLRQALELAEAMLMLEALPLETEMGRQLRDGKWWCQVIAGHPQTLVADEHDHDTPAEAIRAAYEEWSK